jgi:hypothetical protein
LAAVCRTIIKRVVRVGEDCILVSRHSFRDRPNLSMLLWQSSAVSLHPGGICNTRLIGRVGNTIQTMFRRVPNSEILSILFSGPTGEQIAFSRGMHSRIRLWRLVKLQKSWGVWNGSPWKCRPKWRSRSESACGESTILSSSWSRMPYLSDHP